MPSCLYCVIAIYLAPDGKENSDIKGFYSTEEQANTTAQRWRRCLNGFWDVQIWSLRPVARQRIKF